MRYKITTLKNTSLHHYTLWANSKEDALSKARQRDQITPLHIEAKPIFSLAPSHQDIYIALKQFHIMLLANLPLQQCITSIAQNTSNKKLSCIFENISNSLENGLSLYESFMPYENIFGKLTLVMIEFGSKSGKLCECLELLLEELHSQEIAKKEIKKVLFYP
ncbi:type II secretion system F family protein, partial [Helicobacter kayseriensis]|uniref:type II secretion system F family protein n=1 Tax=Helicobacter kayseriensis TaxID=2905877 RepID=UPI001E412346